MSIAQSEARRAEWKDPEVRKKRSEGARRGALRRYQDPEEREKARERMQGQLADSEFQERAAAARRARPASSFGAGGLSNAPEYKVWSQMVQRCTNPKARYYENYGGRGITVCPEWRGRGGFKHFIEHIGRRPSEAHTVERVDNAKGYEPGNVKWATRVEQGNNTRRNRMLTLRGETKTVSQWARALGLPPEVLRARLALGWPVERLGEPVGKRGGHHPRR